MKLSDQRHTVRVERNDGTNESVELDSRSFLRHDPAHFAVELESELTAGSGVRLRVAAASRAAGWTALTWNSQMMADRIRLPGLTELRRSARGFGRAPGFGAV